MFVQRIPLIDDIALLLLTPASFGKTVAGEESFLNGNYNTIKFFMIIKVDFFVAQELKRSLCAYIVWEFKLNMKFGQ